ncbi:MAG: type II toxin-antitoxin system HicA family toxin [Candidatus Micrarchaeia archaeon]
MPKLPVLSGKKVLKVLQKEGFKFSRQKGSHVVMTKIVNGQKLVTVFPMHKELDPGTLLAIISQAGMNREEFFKIL